MDPRLKFIREARGIALEKNMNKDPPDVRPLGINEVFLNVIAKIALKRFGDELQAYLHKHDCGFGVSGGTEKIIHSIQVLYRYCKDHNLPFALGQADLENAFNSADRQIAIDVIRDRAPQLLHFLAFRYSDAKVRYEGTEGSVRHQDGC